MDTTTTLGTRSDPIGATGATAATPNGMPIVQLVIALAVVLALVKWILPKILTRVSKKIVTGIGSQIRIEESAAFAGGNLYIVQAKGKSLLLSVSQQGVQCLADLTEESIPTTIAEPEFEQLLAAAPAIPDFVRVHASAQVIPNQPTETEVQRVLDRLARLESV